MADSEKTNKKSTLRSGSTEKLGIEKIVNSLICRIEQLEQNINSKIATQITDAISQINTKIDSLNTKLESLEAKINKSIDDQITIIKNHIKSEVETQNKRLSDMETKLSTDQNTNMELRLAELERKSHGKDLLINGIPNSITNLHSAFEDICKTIGFNYSSINNNYIIFRVPSGAIIVKFQTTTQKNTFFKKYLSYKKLNLTNIGFDSPRRIFINESLSKHTAELLKKANQLRKDGWISRAFTKNGFLYIQKLPDDDPIKIWCSSQLINRQTNCYASTSFQRLATPSRLMELINNDFKC